MAEKYNPHAGENDQEAQKNRSGFSTTVQNVTGGEFADWGENCGMEVGNPFDEDPMGETESKVTHRGK